MATWIFQANPDKFNIDGYLSTHPDVFLWLVTRNRNEILPDDQVFIWRAAGRSGVVSGIIAEAKVLEQATEQPDLEASRPFWGNDEAGLEPKARAKLALVRAAKGVKQVIKRDWVEEDPILHDLSIIRMPNSTIFKVNDDQAARLNALWLRTGLDWTYEESLAGLWAYAMTRQGQLSRLPGEPISRVALSTGRALSGAYNKVMNFRSLDESDPRRGFRGSAGADRRVWADFYIPGGGIDLEALNVAVKRYWPRLDLEIPESAGQVDEASSRLIKLRRDTASRMALGMERLEARYRAKAERLKNPASRLVPARVYDRDADVIALTRLRAGNRCEAPDCRNETFLDSNRQPYVEVHHIRPLAEGGADTIDNTVCLCPHHHRLLHYGRDAPSLRQVLEDLRREATPQPTTRA